MRKKKNEISDNSSDKLFALLNKPSLEISERAKYDSKVFAKPKVILSDTLKQSLASPSSTTSYSKDSGFVFPSAREIKRSYHSRTSSLMTPLTINDPSFTVQPSTKVTLQSPHGKDFSELGTNNDLHSSTQSIMLSNKKKEFIRFLSKESQCASKIPSRPKKSQRSSFESVSRTSRNQSIESETANKKMMILQSSYKMTMDPCFNVLNQHKKPKRPDKQKKKIPRSYNSQPSSPVSKKGEYALFQHIVPSKPSTKLSEGLIFDAPMYSEGFFTSRTNRKLTKNPSQQSGILLIPEEPQGETLKHQDTLAFTNAFERIKILSERKSKPRINFFEANEISFRPKIPLFDGNKQGKIKEIHKINEKEVDQISNLSTSREIQNKKLKEVENHQSTHSLNKTLSESNINEISTLKSESNKEINAKAEGNGKLQVFPENFKENVICSQKIYSSINNTQSSLIETALQTPMNQVNNLQKAQEENITDHKKSPDESKSQKMLPLKLNFSSLKNLKSPTSIQSFLLADKSSNVNFEDLEKFDENQGQNKPNKSINRRKSSGEMFSLIKKQCQAKMSTPKDVSGSTSKEMFAPLPADFRTNLRRNEKETEGDKVLQPNQGQENTITKLRISENSPDNQSKNEQNDEIKPLVMKREDSNKRGWKFSIQINLSSPTAKTDPLQTKDLDENRFMIPNHNGEQIDLSPISSGFPNNENNSSQTQFENGGQALLPKDNIDRLSFPLFETKILSINSTDRISEPKDNVISTATIMNKEHENLNTHSHSTLISINGQKLSINSLNPTKESIENIQEKSPKKLTADEKRKRNKRSNTSDVDSLLNPNLVTQTKTSREPSPKSSAISIDYITSYKFAQQKLSNLNTKGNSFRDLGLLRSIVKESENNSQNDNLFNKNTSIFSGKAKSPKSKLFKSEQNSFNFDSDNPPITSAKLAPVQSNFSKPVLKKTLTQKSVFAKKKGETNRIDPFKIAVSFENKKGDNDSLSLNFKEKKKKPKQLSRRSSSIFVKHKSKALSDKNLLLNLKQLSSGDGKELSLDLPYKIKVEDQVLLTKPVFEREKTVEFSVSFEETSRVYPPSGISRTGSMRSDINILLGQTGREKENNLFKLVINISPPASENQTTEERPNTSSKNNQNEEQKRFEYIIRPSKYKKSLDYDFLLPQVENLEDLCIGNIDMETYIGNFDKITNNFNWEEQTTYFSPKDEYMNFLRFFEMIAGQKEPFLAYFYENKIQAYGRSLVIEELIPKRSRILQKIINKQSAAPTLTWKEYVEDQIYEDKIIVFKNDLKNASQPTKKNDSSLNASNSFNDDLLDYDILSLQSLSKGLECPPQSIKLRKPLKGHQHIISQLDDRAQAKIFESTGHTVEEYMMLNGLNMQKIAQQHPYEKIAEILSKTSLKNLSWNSKLLSRAYSWLLVGSPEFSYYIKTLDSPRIQRLGDEMTPYQRAVLNRKLSNAFSQNQQAQNQRKLGMLPKQGSLNNKSFIKRETVTKESILNKNKPKSAMKKSFDLKDQQEKQTKFQLQRQVGLSLNFEQKRKFEKNQTIEPSVNEVQRLKTLLIEVEDKVGIRNNVCFNELLIEKSNELRVSKKIFSRTAPSSPRRDDSIPVRHKSKSPKGQGLLQRVLELGRKEKLDEVQTQENDSKVSDKPIPKPFESRMPSRFKQVVESAILKRPLTNKDKFKAINIILKEQAKKERAKSSALSRGTLIKFDHVKTISTREMKMDKGALRMRTQAKSQNKKKYLTILQQTILAVQENRVSELQELFILCPASLLDTKDDNGNNCLGIAAMCGFIEIVKMLLEKGVNVNIPNADGNMPLHLALAFGHYKIADRLLEKGAYQHVPNNHGKFPWDLAC